MVADCKEQVNDEITKGLPPDGVLRDPPPRSIDSEDSNDTDSSSILMNFEAEVMIASDKSTVDCFGISASPRAPINRGIVEEFEHSLLKINDVEAIEGSKIITESSVPLIPKVKTIIEGNDLILNGSKDSIHVADWSNLHALRELIIWLLKIKGIRKCNRRNGC
ncbi:hypothetical protein L2E82_05268 [Cichorium intybus]|uniref:Uncharacterized protein n=1 Tax=Cichorium intybus TaxID=13427 RepID=A0ACB9H7K6_CICIN|nr:hypothetical protein L2E82_05268 [Cichorium intybus]